MFEFSVNKDMKQYNKRVDSREDGDTFMSNTHYQGIKN